MAESRFCDCPICKRTNVVGYKVEEKGAKALLAGGAAILGAVAFGPLGLLGGLALGKMGGAALEDFGKENKFTFKCPNCSHEWSRWFCNK